VFVWFRIAAFFAAESFCAPVNMMRATRYVFDQSLTARSIVPQSSYFHDRTASLPWSGRSARLDIA
jgi:hypothetical protein